MGVRVELKDIPFHASYQEKEIAFRKMLQAFNKAYQESGVQLELRKREHYEPPARKRKIKIKENQMANFKAEMKKKAEKKRSENE